MSSSHQSHDNLPLSSPQRKPARRSQQSHQQAEAISTDPDDETPQSKHSAITNFNKQRLAEKYGNLEIDIEYEEEEEKKDMEEDDEARLIEKSSPYAKAYYLGHQVWMAFLAILLVFEFGFTIFASIYLVFFNDSGPPFYSNVYFWALVVGSPILTILLVRMAANESNELEARSLSSARKASIKLLLVIGCGVIFIIYKICFYGILYNK